MNQAFRKDGAPAWKPWQVFALQFFFIFFLLLSIPIDYKFYVKVWNSGLHLTTLLHIVTYLPDFFGEYEHTPWGLPSFSSWFLATAIALAGALLWRGRRHLSNESADNIYYWLRVVLRYRLAFILIGYGLIKVFPLQMPFPSISNLHTNYGDFLPWKIYFHTVGVAPNYEAFLGAVEVLAGLLLFHRNTVTFGTGIVIGFIGNVLIANISYELGSHVLAAYIVLASLFLFAHDIPRLYRLLALGKPTTAENFQPVFSQAAKRFRWTGKTFSLFLTLLLALAAVHNYYSDPYIRPKGKGIPGITGFYNVKSFVFNNDTIPYTQTDPRRWQNVVFEEWATISIKDARPVILDSSVHHNVNVRDIDRVYESAGVGDRRYYNLNIDKASGQLQLQNKNPHHRSETYMLHHVVNPDATISVKGINEKGDSIHATLEKINRKYMLIEGRRKPVKL